MLKIVEIENPFERRKKEYELVHTGKAVDFYVAVEGRDIFINGSRITDPKHTYPDDGDQVIVLPHIAHGGIGKVLGFVASIALMTYAGAVGGGLWGGMFARGTIGAVLAAGAVMYVGGRVINALFPQDISTSNTSSSDSTQSYSWDLPTPSSSQNSIVGETFGSCIPTPQL